MPKLIDEGQLHTPSVRLHGVSRCTYEPELGGVPLQCLEISDSLSFRPDVWKAA